MAAGRPVVPPSAAGAGAVDHESRVAADLVRRAVIVAPLVLAAVGLGLGVDATLGAAVGLAVVAANFWLSARLIAWSAQISPGVVMGAVLGGYIVRLAAILAVALVVRAVPGIDLTVFVVTVAVAHVVLLCWELPAVGLTLGAPGLKPRPLREKEQGW